MIGLLLSGWLAAIAAAATIRPGRRLSRSGATSSPSRGCSVQIICRSPNNPAVWSVRYFVPQPNNSPRGRPSRRTVYERLATQITELKQRLGGLPSPVEAEGIWRGTWLEEAHHSTAIEGNTLFLKQVEALLAEGRAVGNRELREYLEVRGYADAADWVYGQAIAPEQWTHEQLITVTELRRVHELTMTAVWDSAPHPQATDREGPGSFREHDIEPFPEGMTPPQWPAVPVAVEESLARESLSADPLNFPEALTSVHARLEQIHPFLDGNGRAGRLVLDLLLARLGYPPAIIYERDRSRYLKALRRADHADFGPLGEFLARAVLDNLHKFVVPAVAGPARLAPLPALQTPDLSANALSVTAIRGRLKAAKASDGTWRSSRAWVDDHIASRHKRAG